MSHIIDSSINLKTIPSNVIVNGCIPFVFKKTFPKASISDFNGNLRDLQSKVADLVDKHILEGKCSFLLKLCTNFGKTVLSLYIISKYSKSKALIIVPRVEIIKQWNKSIKKFVKNKNIDVIGPLTLKNKILKRYEYDIIIIDEAHMLCDMIFNNLLYKFTPEILIGLTATPKKQLCGESFEMYKYFFHTMLSYSDITPFLIHPVFLNFKPTIEYINIFINHTRKRVKNYSLMLKSLSENIERVNFIVNIIRSYINKHKLNSLILTKRKYSATRIFDILKEDFNCTLNIDLDKSHTKNSEVEVLIGTYSKIGVGFDDSKWKMLFILDNVIDIEQAKGRIRYNNFLLVDFVDNDELFIEHWNTRKKFYESKGGTIK